jgi:hypothetical protein
MKKISLVILAVFCVASIAMAAVLFSDNFESGWGNWVDGGVMCDRVATPGYAHSGTYAVRIGGAAPTSVTRTGSINLVGKTQLTVAFFPRTANYIGNQTFYLQLSNNGGSTYTTKATYTGTSYIFFPASPVVFTIDSSAYTFTSNVKVQFKGGAPSGSQYVFLDDITVSTN